MTDEKRNESDNESLARSASVPRDTRERSSSSTPSSKLDSVDNESAPAAATSHRPRRTSSGGGFGIVLHLVLLAAAVTFALTMWMRQDDQEIALGDVTVWEAEPEQVTKIVFTLGEKRVELESHDDELGRWFSGVAIKPKAPEGPHGGPHGAPPGPPPGVPQESITVEFVSVGTAAKVSQALAPLRAVRALGRIPDDRIAEFGLAEPQGSLLVTIGGAERKLILGDRAPGGSDQYVRVDATGEVYVLKAEALKDLEGADQRLMERDLHEWTESEVKSATIIAGDRTRQLVRSGPEGKRFWAAADAPEHQDETIGNWMTKVSRARPNRYEPPPAAATTVFRIEYAGRLGGLGHVELLRAAGEEEGKHDYWIVSERTRRPAEIAEASAVQMEQDLPSVLP